MFLIFLYYLVKTKNRKKSWVLAIDGDGWVLEWIESVGGLDHNIG